MLGWWLSATFLVSGYLHVHVLYGHFGVDVGDFFHVTDYVSSSIDQLRHAAVGMLGWLLGAQPWQTASPAVSVYRHERFWQGSITSWLTIVAFVALVALSYAPGDEGFQLLRWMPLIAISIAYVPVVLLSRRFHGTGVMIFLAVFTIGFTSSLLGGAHLRIAEVKDNPGSAFVVHTAERTYTHHSWSIIGGNSRYLFLYSKGRGVEIVPVARVDDMRVGPGR